MNIRFIKMEALGNDYVYVVEPDNQGLELNKLIRTVPKMCDRHFGIGSDGVIVVGLENGSVWARIYNPDGSEAESCGNGLRCVAKIAFDKNMTAGKKDISITLKKTGRKVHAFLDAENTGTVTVDMGKVKVSDLEELNKIEFIPVDMGNPHAVIFMKNIETLDIESVGPAIEKNKRFPDRTNVEFVEVVSKKEIKLRVWERGVGETLACGTGACAAVAAAFYSGLCDNNVLVNMPGGKAEVSMDEQKSMHLTGPVNYVFKGEYLIP